MKTSQATNRPDRLRTKHGLSGLLMLCTIVLGGCAIAQPVVSKSRIDGKVELLAGPDLLSTLASSAQPGVLREKDLAADVVGLCGGTTPRAPSTAEPQAILPALLIGWLAEEVGSWVVRETDKKLQAELKRYTTTSAIVGDFDFYQALQTGQGEACLHATRAIVEANDSRTVIMDFVALVRYDPDYPEVFAITPVRLYVAQTFAKTADARIALDVKLRLDTVTLRAGGGHHDDALVDHSLIATIVPVMPSVGPTPFHKVFVDTQGRLNAKVLRSALLPWDVSGATAGPRRHNFTEATVTSTEVGNIPWLLEEAANLVDSNRDGIAKDLSDAIKKAAGQ